RLGEQVRTEPAQIGVTLEVPVAEKLRDWNGERYGLEVARGDQDPHLPAWALPPFTATIDVPAAVHPHVRPQDQVARETHQHVLADGLDSFDRPPGHGRIVVDPVERRKDGFERDDRLAGQGAMERARGAKYRVAFRHFRLLIPFTTRLSDPPGGASS